MKTFLLSICCLFGVILLAQTSKQQAPQESQNPQIDFLGFLKTSKEVAKIRQSKLLSLEDFKKMAATEGTIILDTRSKENFEDRHIKGAIHLNFSEFTEDKLAALIPSKKTNILIYCNNNFRGDIRALALKIAPMALNIPTYINLHGYGYQNIYELGDVVELPTEELEMAGRLEE